MTCQLVKKYLPITNLRTWALAYKDRIWEVNIFKLSHVMRKPVDAIWEQQRRRSACASAQSDQRLYCSLHWRYNISSFYVQNFKPLPSLCGCTGRFESTLVTNAEDRFSRDEAQLKVSHKSDMAGPSNKQTLYGTLHQPRKVFNTGGMGWGREGGANLGRTQFQQDYWEGWGKRPFQNHWWQWGAGLCWPPFLRLCFTLILCLDDTGFDWV